MDLVKLGTILDNTAREVAAFANEVSERFMIIDSKEISIIKNAPDSVKICIILEDIICSLRIRL